MSGTHGCVLVVDDDPDLGEILSYVLERAGYASVVVENGQEAMKQLRGGLHPCLILLDLMMPVMNGWQFRAAQSQDPALSAIPVVILTADWESLDRAAGLGVAACLAKPVEPGALFSLVRRYCG
jgi:CheY-like chemotaxis protein